MRLQEVQDCMLPFNTTEEELAWCNVYLSVCKPLGSEVCPDYPDSTTCQEVMTTNGDRYYYDMGTYEGNKEFYPITGKHAVLRQGHGKMFCR
jgi:hypothetical protein